MRRLLNIENRERSLHVPATVIVTALGLAAVAFVLWTGGLAAWTAWIIEAQRELHGRLSAALTVVREEGVGAAWPLIALSFAYGVFHAAGPGHGKLVITTYLATQNQELRSALLLTVAAALAQAITAIVAVWIAVTVLGFTLREARGGVGDLEIASFALVAGLGALLIWRAGRRLARAGHGSHTGGCGHHHHVPAGAPGGRWAALGVVGSIGIRPCAGAVLVLLLAHAGDIWGVGIAAALAMAVGTALTTSALAVLAVSARQTARRLASALPVANGTLDRWSEAAALIGGIVLLIAGLVLVQAAWTMPAHPFR